MRALIMVDIQNDFCTGGSLAIPEGERIIPFINSIQKDYDLVVATQDFHPKGHKSFASYHGKKAGEVVSLKGFNQVLWPDHCVERSPGAEFRPELCMMDVRIFKKGRNLDVDSYSGFFDNDKKSATGLDSFLLKNHVKQVDIVGLALDYCVKHTAIDAKNLGYKVRVLKDGTKSVNLFPNDESRAILEMESLKIEVI